jgi:hypothetical protein
MLSKIPGGINIRTLQTLEKISVEPSQKTLVLLPSELTNLKDIFGKYPAHTLVLARKILIRAKDDKQNNDHQSNGAE